MHGHCNSPAPVTQNGKPLACTLKKIIFHDWKIGCICFIEWKKRTFFIYLPNGKNQFINVSWYYSANISGMYVFASRVCKDIFLNRHTSMPYIFKMEWK